MMRRIMDSVDQKQTLALVLAAILAVLILVLVLVVLVLILVVLVLVLILSPVLVLVVIHCNTLQICTCGEPLHYLSLFFRIYPLA